ncbi:hypothetical protein IGI04_003694 [Brassica rapa subsp. trilocularis]|uniref:Uncharacterized protein n=1 Tax=Brassica rapa subsp. trilocularis TaxID=1813537 RepID=A0ABQ7NZ57_BRACM|nr:hypothetical protein IGI04_003694 [Brassica rapa subsp. trilocularis]
MNLRFLTSPLNQNVYIYVSRRCSRRIAELLGGKDVKKAGELLGVNLVALDEKALIFSVDDVDPRAYRNSETQQFQISAEGRVNLWAKLIRCYQKQHPLQAHGLSCCHTLQRPDQDCGAVGADTNRKFQTSSAKLVVSTLFSMMKTSPFSVSRCDDYNPIGQRTVCVCVSVFDKVVTLLDEKLTLLGWLFFNAIFGTHFYFGHETLVSKCFLKVLCGAEGYYSSTPSTYGGVKKIKTVTLAELNTYVLNSQPHATEFLCKVEVFDIKTLNLLGGKDVKKAGELLGVNLVALDEKALIFSVDDVDPRAYRNSETQQFQISAEGRVNLWAKLIRCYQKQHPLQAHGLSCCHTLQRPDQDCGAVGADTNRKFQTSWAKLVVSTLFSMMKTSPFSVSRCDDYNPIGQVGYSSMQSLGPISTSATKP